MNTNIFYFLDKKFLNRIFSILFLFLLINTSGLCCLMPLYDEDLRHAPKQDVIVHRPHRTFYESFYIYYNGDPEIIYEKKSIAPYSRLSKIAGLYVDTWNAPDMSIFQKIFSDGYKDEELKEKKDIKYNGLVRFWSCLLIRNVVLSLREERIYEFIGTVSEIPAKRRGYPFL